jgi:hypothetical protein
MNRHANRQVTVPSSLNYNWNTPNLVMGVGTIGMHWKLKVWSKASWMMSIVQSNIDQVTTWSDSDGSLPGRVTTGVESTDYDQYEGPSAERSERGEPDDGPLRPSAVEQVIIFAKAMTQSIWKEIAAELGDTKKAQEIKRQLAYHGWCDLFIGLVKVVKKYQDCLSRIPEDAKELVKWAILGSSMQANGRL